MEIVIGIDINEFKVQVSYAALSNPTNVKTLALSSRGDGTLVETAICKRLGVNQWYYGMDALKKAKNGQGLLVENIWQKLCRKETVTLDGNEYEMPQLCNLFLKRIVTASILKIQEELEEEAELSGIVIAAQPLPANMREELAIVTHGLLPEGEEVFWQGYEESLFAYLIHQPERMLGYETGVMDLSNENLVAYRIEMNHRSKPIVTFIKRMETMLERKKHYPSITEHDEALARLDAQFAELASGFVKDRLVTTFYLVGDGFEGNWCNESLKVLCRNRKVYAGNNLYSKGAAYSALERIQESDEPKQYIFLGRNMLLANIGVMVMDGEREEYCPLLDAGTNWYDAKSEMMFYMDEADELAIRITPVSGKKPYEEMISLAALDSRDKETYRIKLTLSMLSETKLKVEISDEGFGDIYPRSAQKIEQIIEVGGEN